MKVKKSDELVLGLLDKKDFDSLFRVSNENIHNVFGLLLNPIVYKQDKISDNRRLVLKFINQLKVLVGH